MNNAEVAEKLDQIGTMYVAAGDTWRAKTFLGAAKIVGGTEGSLANIESVKGIGKSTAMSIQEIIQTGTCTRLTELAKKFPSNALSLTAIDGVGPKGAYVMCKEHGIGSLDELIAKLEKTGEDPHLLKLAMIGKLHVAQGRLPRSRVTPLVTSMTDALRSIQGVVQVEPAGSYRRQCETVRDVDLLVQADPVSLDEIQATFSKFGTLLAAGKKKMRLRHEGTYQDGYGQHRVFILYVDLLVVPEKSWGSAICYFTGSKKHNVELRMLAIEKGIHVNEHGIYRGTESDESQRIGGAKETDLYDLLGIPFVEPQDRDL